MNVLQNMNTKRDTLEKRAFIKNQFQETTIVGNNSGDTSSALIPPAHSEPEYLPSLEDQYLPKSLRGSNSNPYNIMNAMSENVSSAIQPDQSNVTTATSIPSGSELETSIISSNTVVAASETGTTNNIE